MQNKLQRIRLRTLLVRSQDTGFSAGHFDRSRMIGKIQVQHIKSAGIRFDPFRRRAIVGQSWPHAFHLGSEFESKRDRPQGLNLKECQNPCSVGCVVWRKKNFPQGKIRVREGDGRVIGPHLDHRRLLVHINGYGVVPHLRADAKVAKNLPWEDPCLERTVLPAQDCPSRSNDAKRFRWHRFPHNLERYAVFKWKVRQDWRSIDRLGTRPRNREIQEQQQKHSRRSCLHRSSLWEVCLTTEAPSAVEIASARRLTSSGGSKRSSSTKAALVQPNPTTFAVYPALTWVADDRLTTLYFSRIVPSRTKFSSTVERNLVETWSASALCP